MQYKKSWQVANSYTPSIGEQFLVFINDAHPRHCIIEVTGYLGLDAVNRSQVTYRVICELDQVGNPVSSSYTPSKKWIFDSDTWLFNTVSSPDSHSKQETIMTLNLNAIAKRMFDKDTRTLIEAGYLTAELDLTSKGQQSLFAIMFEGHKAELVKLAQEELEAAKTKKGC